MNIFEVLIVVFTLIGVILACWAPGAAAFAVVLAVGALLLFGPRAGD